MRRLKARKVNSPNGEVHFILDESQVSEHSERFRDYDAAEIKKVSRREASKPLVLFREE